MSPTVTGDFKNAVLYIGIFFLLMLLSYRYLNRNTVGRLPGMRQIKRVMKRDVSY